ncbi:MAG: enoyl-CoA hydratase/isomerase family protein [Thermoleophilia bacterium]
MDGFETVLYEREGHVAYVTLNRPQVLNVYSVQMRDDLYEVLSAVKVDDEIRAIILKGAGEKAFCAGADLSEFLTAPSVVKARQIRLLRDLWGLFRSMPQPLIAALHGYVLGSGMEMSLFCDIRIAAENAVFGLPEMGLGIIPGAGGTQTLPRVIGLSRSLDMLLTNRRLDAQEALTSGLVSRVVPGDRLLETVEEVAQQISSYSVAAVRNAKQAVHQGLDMTLAQGLDLERRLSMSTRGAEELAADAAEDAARDATGANDG